MRYGSITYRMVVVLIGVTFLFAAAFTQYPILIVAGVIFVAHGAFAAEVNNG